MTGVFILGALLGLALLIFAWSREHARDADAFTALDRLDVAGPLAMRATFTAAAVAAALAALAGLPALTPAGRATVALALLIAVWLVWLGAWTDLRWLLDAAVVFQDHVAPERRPPLAFSHAPHAALSFRPVTAALVLLAALGVTGLGFGVLAGYFGWTQFLPALAAAVWAAIGLAFFGYLRAAWAGERRLRAVLGDPSGASDEELLEALRRNPRSARLLVEHARRLEFSGEPLQALLEYRAAMLSGSYAEQAAEGATRCRRKLTARPGPVRGSIVRRRRGGEPRMELEPLQPPSDAIPVRVLDGGRFLRELLALADEGLIFNVQGEVEERLAAELRRFEHLAPLVGDDPARPHLSSRSWRLAPEVRGEIERACAEGVPKQWVNIHVHTLDRMLVDAHSHFALVLAAPDLVQREFIEWRRAAAVAPMAESQVESR